LCEHDSVFILHIVKQQVSWRTITRIQTNDAC